MKPASHYRSFAFCCGQHPDFCFKEYVRLEESCRCLSSLLSSPPSLKMPYHRIPYHTSSSICRPNTKSTRTLRSIQYSHVPKKRHRIQIFTPPPSSELQRTCGEVEFSSLFPMHAQAYLRTGHRSMGGSRCRGDTGGCGN